MKLSTDRKRQLNNLKEQASSLLYPRVCPGCGKVLGKVFWGFGQIEKGNPYICRECYGKLDFLEGRPRCMKCSKPLDDESGEYCRDCMEKDRYFDWGRALMTHGETARKIMYDLKYSSLRDNGDFLGLEMCRRMAGVIKQMDAQVIIPVPLHRKRELERGYNQALEAAEKLRLFMELEGLDCPATDDSYLIRSRNTARLKEVKAGQRAANLSGAFEINGPLGKYKRVILFDDIYTTGSTVNECAKMLRIAGVDVIYFITCTVGS